MNTILTIKKFLLCFTSTIVAQLPADDFQGPGNIIDPVICKSDPTQSYALYIPVKPNRAALPIIYFFDAHGDGALPLTKYRALADQYGFILAGSNNSKNGNDWQATENIWRHILDDTKNRLNTNANRIYTCGFSGGAKVAAYLALKDQRIKGVIANSAGLPDGTPASDFPFSFTAMAGEGDMNLTDLIALNKDLDHTKTRHHLIVFEGKHEWASENSMSEAFMGLQLDAMEQALIPKDEPWINQCISWSKKRLVSYEKANLLIKVAEECTLMIGYLQGINAKESEWYGQKLTGLKSNTQYQRQRQAQENILQEEQETKQGYMAHFQVEDENYWVITLNELQTKARAKTGEQAMYQRLLAYLSLAFYSLSNRLIAAGENAGARYFVDLYKMADPINSEAWYFSAILNARNNQVQATKSDLMKAAGYGFKDKTRMRQQPEFQKLSAQINFPEIEGRMRPSANEN